MSEHQALISPSLYHPLDREKQEIRLMRLLNTQSDTIEGELQTFELANAPVYKALSYAWGTDSSSQTILRNGTRSRQISISRNLYDFLRVFSKYRDQPWIWIDQLSIAQECVQEKNHQVGMMGEIYRHAEETLVWLGSDPHDGVVPALIEEWRSTAEETRDLDQFRDLDADENHAVATILEVSYWTRHWVAQELSLSKERAYLYGDLHVDVKVLEALSHGAAITQRRPLRMLSELVYFLNSSSPSVQCKIFCEFARNSQCCDLRDKVFGLQSVLPPSLRIKVDYSMSVWEVFVYTVQRWYTYLRESGKSDTANSFSFLFWCENLAVGMGICSHDDGAGEETTSPQFEQRVAALEENFILPAGSHRIDEYMLALVLVNLVLPGPDWETSEVAKRYVLKRRPTVSKEG